MKNVINFWLFIIYSTCVFFIPNDKIILIFFIINLLLMLFSRTNIKKIIDSTIKFLPFIIFTFIINCLLDEIINAFWIAIKLIIVCNITMIYSNTTSIMRNCRDNKIIM